MNNSELLQCKLLQHLEEELWREETRFDGKRMKEIVAGDFIEFGRSGRIYCREDLLAVPRQPIDVVLPLPDFEVRVLHPDLAQVTYTSVVRHGEALQRARRSSIWSRVGTRWVLRFHQATPIPD